MKNTFAIVRFYLGLFLLFMLLSCNGSIGRGECAGDAIIVERAAIPNVAVPSLDTAAFVNKVHIECTHYGFLCSSLPQGVTTEDYGDSLLIRSRVPGVEYVLCGDASNASITIVSEYSPLLTLRALILAAHGRNTLEVSSKEVIFLRTEGKSLVTDVVGSEKADNQSAAVKLMGRASLCGGELVVESVRRSAIFCTDTLYLSGISLHVKGAPNNAILANKSIVLSSGTVDAVSSKDVLKCKNGDFVMTGGTLAVSSMQDKADAVQAVNVYVSGGCIAADMKGAASDGLKAKGVLCIAGGNISVATHGGALFNSKKSDYSSASCLKSDAVVDISGGNCAFLSKGNGAKGVSCDSMLVVSGGNLSVVTEGCDVVHPVDINAHASSKGIKCDGSIYLLGGNVEVAVFGEGERSEGVESKGTMYISGGARLYVYAYDDALNATDIYVSDGFSYLYSVANDALDSNGAFEMSGGVLVADGSFSPEQGVDVDDFNSFAISGGTLLSVGGSMGPLPALPLNGNTSAQVAVWSGVKAVKGKCISLTDESGTLIAAYRVARDMDNAAFLVSSPSIKSDAVYTFAVSDTIVGADHVGNGLYADGESQGSIASVAFKARSGVNCVSDDGSLIVVEPGKGMPHGMTPPPPPMMDDSATISAPPNGGSPFKGGMMPPPPPGEGFAPRGGFPPPPPPMRKVKNEYGKNNLPNKMM